MKTSQAGIDLIKEFEGLRLRAYPDPLTGGAPYTCGYGCANPSISPDTVWTQDYAEQRLKDDLTSFEGMVNKAVYVALTQGQFDALVSITFNVGPGSTKKDGIIMLRTGHPSTLLACVNRCEYDKAADQFLRWVSPGSSVEAGLRRRREAERALFVGVPA